MALLLSACSPSSPAAADEATTSRFMASAVVIESNDPNYSVGTELARGSEVTLAAGQRLVIMHRSGAVRTFEAPGLHAVDTPDDARITTARAAMAALMSDAPRPEIGATRSFDYEACLEAAQAENGFPQSLCDELRAEHADVATLSVRIIAADDRLTPESPFRLELESSFDAFVVCSITPSPYARQTALALGRGPAGALFLPAGVVVHAPPRGGKPIRLGDAAGDYQLDCTAYDAGLWRTLQTARGETPGPLPAQEWLAMVENYGAMVGEKQASANRTFTLSAE